MHVNLKYFFSLFLIFAISISSFAVQSIKSPVVDSLERQIENSSNTHTLIRSHSQLCWILRSVNPGRSIEHGNKAIRLINENPKYDHLKAEALNYLGVAHRNKGDYSNAMDYYFEALSKAELHKNDTQIAYSYNNLGGIFTLKGDYIDAIDYLKRAHVAFGSINNLDGLGYACVNLGNLYRHSGDYDEALNYFDKAISYKKNDSIGAAITINLKAITYFQKKEYDKAQELYILLEDLYVRNNDLKGLSTIKNYLGVLEVIKGNYKKSLRYFNESIKLYSKIQSSYGIALSKVDMSLAYMGLGDYKTAIKSLKEGSKTAKEMGDLQLLLKSYQNFSDVYYTMGQYKTAYDYRLKYQESNASHLSTITKERLSAFRINKELGKKKSKTEIYRARILELEEIVVENDKQKDIMIYIVIAMFVIILVIFISFIILRKKSRHSVHANKNLESKNIQLKESNDTRERFLSIIGHDLKNPFNSVLGLTSLLIEEWETLPEDERLLILNEVHASSNSIYELMDNLLLWAKKQADTIQISPERFDLNENIIDVYEIFRNQATYKKIKISLNIGANNFVSADPNMINTVLRNLLSNAVKFTRKGGEITINMKRLSNEVEFSITDSGKGIPPEDLKKILDDRSGFSTKGTNEESGTGLGLLVVRDFVQKNNGVFWIESKVGTGSRFCFTLPD